MATKKIILGVVLVFIMLARGVAQPAILSHPSDTSVCSGSTVTYYITASNAEYYQWQEFDGTGWFTIGEEITYAEGENTPTLTLNDVIIGLNDYQYRCYVEDEAGQSAISNSASLNVYDPPLIISHPQNKEVCKNETATFNILAENVTNYQWQENRGNGWYNLSDNSFYNGSATQQLQIFTIFGIDDYQYRCKVFNNSCSEISVEALLEVNPLPQVFYAFGGGEICENDAGVEIFLNDSEISINYELLHEGQTTVAVREGTGGELTFGLHHEAGVYTVRAVDAVTACQNMMSGTAVIETYPAPQGFDLIGADVYCQGTAGATLFLEGSQISKTYTLLRDGNPTGYILEGTGGSLSFTNISAEGSYSVKATDQQTGCTGFMNNTLGLSEQPAPQVFTLSGDEHICDQEEGAILTLSGSQQEMIYTLLREGQQTGALLQGTGEALNFDNILEPGTYTVRAQHTESSCEGMMNGAVNLETVQPLHVFSLSGPSFLCDNKNGFIELSGSQIGILYTLVHNENITSNTLFGNGQPLSFIIDSEGAYQIIATDAESGCAQMMEGEVYVQQQAAPIANAGNDKEIQDGGTVLLEGSASGGSGQYFYQWQPSELLQNPTQPQSLSIALSSPQLFTLQVEDAVSGCVSLHDSTFVSIEGGSYMVQAFTSEDSLCRGESAQLFAYAQGGTGSYSFYWYTEDGTFSSTDTNPVVSPEENTEYIIRIDDGMTLVEDTIAIAVNEVPQIFSLSGENSFCMGSEGAQLMLSGMEENTEYELFRNGLPYNTFFEIPLLQVQQGGTYTVKASDGGCQVPMDGVVEVTAHDKPVVDAGEDQLIFTGQPASLAGEAYNGSGGYSYQWQPQHLLDSPASNNTTTVPLYASTQFALTASDTQTGCFSSADTVVVMISGELLEVTLIAGQEEVCPGNGVNLSAIGSGGSKNYSYQWNSNPEGFFSADSVVQVYPIVSTTYFVTVTDGDFSVTDSVTINVKQAPAAQQVTGGGAICPGSPGTELALQDTEEGVYYSLWNSEEELINAVSGDGEAISLGLIAEQDSYHVTATHIETSCSSQMMGTPVVFEYEKPMAFAGEDVVIASGTTASLNGYGSGGSGQYNYFWSPAAMVQNATQPSTTTVNLTSSALLRLEVTDQVSGCTSTPDSILVNVSGNNLSLVLQNDQTNICQGTSVSLFALASGGSGQYSYEWSSQPPGINADGYFATHIPEATTFYTVSVSDGQNTVQKTLQVEVQEAPVANAGADQQVNYGEHAVLLGEVQGGSGSYAYQWSPNGLLVGEGNSINSQTLPLMQDVEYTFSATDLTSGCASASDTVGIEVLGSALDVTVFATTEQICSGREVTLSSLVSGENGEVSYKWYSDPPGMQSTEISLQTDVFSTTTFYVEVTDENGIATDSITITATPSPELFVLIGEAIYCEGEPGTTLELNDSENPMRYQLLRNGIFTGMESAGTGSAVSFENLSSHGLYTVLAISQENGCYRIMNGSKEVREEEIPYRFALEGGGALCEEESTTINLSGSEPGIAYQLFADNTSLDTITGTGDNIPFETNAREGSYLIVATDTLTGCATEMLNEVAITTNPSPELQVSSDTSIYRGNSVVLMAQGATSYQWNTIPQQSGSMIQVAPEESSTYSVTGTNEYGCNATAAMSITVLESVLPDANAFTPNGDGVNDRFREGYHIIIFNRWGNKLFEGNEGWDGTFDGQNVPSGTYYFVQSTDISGNEITSLKGSVTVIRKQH